MIQQMSKQISKSFISDLIANLPRVRIPFQSKQNEVEIVALCDALISAPSEVGILPLASSIFQRYSALDEADRVAFFYHLNEQLDINAERAADAAALYSVEKTPENYQLLRKHTVSKRFALFQRLNQIPDGTEKLVRMRAELLRFLKNHPELLRTDQDFQFLLRSWFNRGFLVLKNISWASPATLLEKIIAYEAVHKIDNWEDLRQRLQPYDRRCFAFFHPSMPDEPLIFVEVALTKGIPGNIDEILSLSHAALDVDQIDTATFYSISNCQPGLANVSFGNSLIKQVVQNLSVEFPKIKNYVTLSPIPGLAKWAESVTEAEEKAADANLMSLTARYLIQEKNRRGQPLDPVARFHLSNGAEVFRLRENANSSQEAQSSSFGMMVNYLYDLNRVSENQYRYHHEQHVRASKEVQSLCQ